MVVHANQFYLHAFRDCVSDQIFNQNGKTGQVCFSGNKPVPFSFNLVYGIDQSAFLQKYQSVHS